MVDLLLWRRNRPRLCDLDAHELLRRGQRRLVLLQLRKRIRRRDLAAGRHHKRPLATQKTLAKAGKRAPPYLTTRTLVGDVAFGANVP